MNGKVLEKYQANQQCVSSSILVASYLISKKEKAKTNGTQMLKSVDTQCPHIDFFNSLLKLQRMCTHTHTNLRGA